MTTHATATFEVVGWDETTYVEASEAPKLARVTVRKTFQGGVIGESIAELLMSGAVDGGAGYIAQERVTGRIGERSGSFDMQHGGARTASGEIAQNFGYIVPGSGTGELRGLSGEVRFRHDEQGAVFSIEYEFS